jgi:hypothetical protein
MLSLLGGKMMIYGVILAVCLIAIAVIARNWSCRHHRDPRPPKAETVLVDSVPSGNTITGHLSGRRARETTVTLQWLAVPESVAIEATTNLAKLTGTKIRVEYARRMGSEEEATGVYARGPIIGIAYGESGVPLNLSQLADGWADVQPGAPPEFVKARDQAKKLHVGMWRRK